MQTSSKKSGTRPSKARKEQLKSDSFEEVARRLGGASEKAFNAVLKRVGKAKVAGKPVKNVKKSAKI